MAPKSRSQISVLSVSLCCGKKAVKHVGISGARNNNISATRELRGGEFVKGRRGRKSIQLGMQIGLRFDIVDVVYGSKGPNGIYIRYISS